MIFEIVKGLLCASGFMIIAYQSVENYVKAEHNRRMGEAIGILVKDGNALEKPVIQKYVRELTKKFI